MDALPSCENMSWSLFTRGMTDCPKKADGGPDEGDAGTPDGDPASVPVCVEGAGCDMVTNSLPCSSSCLSSVRSSS